MRKEQIKTYEQAVDYLYRVPFFTSKNTLEDTKQFLHKLGNPDTKMHIIHVAGTNGKGSVCAYLSSILGEAGKKVAMFTSPHLVDIRERFTINGEMINKNTFLDAFLLIYNDLEWDKLEKGGGYHPTFFEYLFLMAMVIFSKEDLDYCILETGLGGRLDATNAVSTKELSIITRISVDHEEYLGSTVAEIAREKAGIMMKRVPLVFEDADVTVTKELVEHAKALDIQIFPMSKYDYVNLKFNKKTIDFSIESRYYGYIKLSLHTIANYQVENAALAVRAIEVLDQGRTITQDQIREGIQNCFWPGRMEEILPQVYVDGAHNADGIRAFGESVSRDGHAGKRKLLFSAVQDKDYDRMLSEVIEMDLFQNIVITHMHSSRGASVADIENIIRRYPGCAYTIANDVGTALHKLMAGQKAGERIYIAGSLYLVGEIKELVKNDKF